MRFMGSLFAGGGPRLQRDVGYLGSTKKDWWGPALMERQIWKWGCTGWVSHELLLLQMEKRGSNRGSGLARVAWVVAELKLVLAFKSELGKTPSSDAH